MANSRVSGPTICPCLKTDNFQTYFMVFDTYEIRLLSLQKDRSAIFAINLCLAT